MKDIMRESRKVELQQRFDELMPCNDCILSQICKHRHSISRPNYNDEVFDITITCKIKEHTIKSIREAERENELINRIGVE